MWQATRGRGFLISSRPTAKNPTEIVMRSFEMPEVPAREAVVRGWESAWTTTFGTLESLTPDDLRRTVTIRGEPFLVFEALNRLAAHTAYHVGQIVFLAKHFAGSN